MSISALRSVAPTAETVQIIRRSDIPCLSSVEVDGITYLLGEQRDLRRVPGVSELIPDNARLAVSWCLLKPGETLHAHTHPIVTMILVAKGQGRLFGQRECTLGEGDTVLVPAGCEHGFVGEGPDGIWTLSIQFEASGLYENPKAPLVRFSAASKVEQLHAANRKHIERHVATRFYKMLDDGTLGDETKRRRFFQCVRFWSDRFQTVVLSRQAACDDPAFASVFLEHLREELGHNELLPDHDGFWDPVLDATGSWFVSKMSRLDNVERLALVHLVLETSAAVFHGRGKEVVSRQREDQFFDVHVEADEGHHKLGDHLLALQSAAAFDRLERVIAEGWKVLDAMLDRMTELVLAA